MGTKVSLPERQEAVAMEEERTDSDNADGLGAAFADLERLAEDAAEDEASSPPRTRTISSNGLDRVLSAGHDGRASISVSRSPMRDRATPPQRRRAGHNKPSPTSDFLGIPEIIPLSPVIHISQGPAQGRPDPLLQTGGKVDGSMPAADDEFMRDFLFDDERRGRARRLSEMYAELPPGITSPHWEEASSAAGTPSSCNPNCWYDADHTGPTSEQQKFCLSDESVKAALSFRCDCKTDCMKELDPSFSTIFAARATRWNKGAHYKNELARRLATSDLGDDGRLYISGVQVCSKVYAEVNGVTKSMLEQARPRAKEIKRGDRDPYQNKAEVNAARQAANEADSLRRARVKTSLKIMGTGMLDAEFEDELASDMQEGEISVGQRAVASKEEKLVLPFPSKHAVYLEYVRREEDCGSEPYSESHFLTLWDELCPYIKLQRSVKDHGRCGSCEFFFDCLRRRQSLSKEEFEKARKEFDAHIKSAKLERHTYATTVAGAMPTGGRKSGNYWSLIIDEGGTDNSSLPIIAHGVNVKNLDKANLFKMKMVGVLVHWIQPRVYVVSSAQCHGGNLTCEVLLDTLCDLVDEVGAENAPRVLKIQADSCSGSNKCRAVLALAEWLVLEGIFDEITISYMIVGHTHEDIDRLFITVARKTRSKQGGVFTYDEWKEIALEALESLQQSKGRVSSYRLKPEIIWLDHVRDFTALLVPDVDKQLSRYALSKDTEMQIHAMHFGKSGDRVGMMYKYASDDPVVKPAPFNGGGDKVETITTESGEEFKGIVVHQEPEKRGKIGPWKVSLQQQDNQAPREFVVDQNVIPILTTTPDINNIEWAPLKGRWRDDWKKLKLTVKHFEDFYKTNPSPRHTDSIAWWKTFLKKMMPGDDGAPNIPLPPESRRTRFPAKAPPKESSAASTSSQTSASADSRFFREAVTFTGRSAADLAKATTAQEEAKAAEEETPGPIKTGDIVVIFAPTTDSDSEEDDEEDLEDDDDVPLARISSRLKAAAGAKEEDEKSRRKTNAVISEAGMANVPISLGIVQEIKEGEDTLKGDSLIPVQWMRPQTAKGNKKTLYDRRWVPWVLGASRNKTKWIDTIERRNIILYPQEGTPVVVDGKLTKEAKKALKKSGNNVRFSEFCSST